MKVIKALLVVFFLFLTCAAQADEGMWLFNAPPLQAIRDAYGFEPSPEWLDHLQKSSIRFGGASGSFVSPEGLVMTNHHVGLGCLQKLSTPEHNYVQDGFYAKTRDEEMRCHDVELDVLMSIEDVTDRVKSAVHEEMTSAQAEKARRSAMLEIEAESLKQTGLRSDVVTLYRGGLFHLYRYKRYTDVRLVFAPEAATAFFGGDPDNFEYPRYDLDITFFRVYENDRPVESRQYLAWSAKGAQEGDAVFVSGNPGRTERLDTIDHLAFLRDRVLPSALNLLRRREVLLYIYSSRSLENDRRAHQELFGTRNGRKNRLGQLATLQDPAVFALKAAKEKGLRDAVSSNPGWRRKYGDAWDQVDGAIAEWGKLYDRYNLLESGTAFNTRLFRIARNLVRLTEEIAKPNSQRLREFGDSHLPSLRQDLYSEAPIYKDLETVKLADSLGMYLEMRGPDDPLVQKVLQGKSPVERAKELVDGTGLQDVSLRKQLAQSGAEGIRSSTDPMIQLALLVDPEARSVRSSYKENVEERFTQAYAKIMQAMREVSNGSAYPDATSTLRLSYGSVRGYSEEGNPVPALTTIGGAYKHAAEHGDTEPFRLPDSWIAARQKVDAATPLDFVTTADIVGGNSGSPVVNRDGEIVGVIFDGNIQSLAWTFLYTDNQARSVAVDSRGIIEALDKIYAAERLVGELRAAHSPRQHEN